MPCEKFLSKCQKIPQLYHRTVRPAETVCCVEDAKSYQNCNIVPAPPRSCFSSGDETVLDFGEHLVGFFSFQIDVDEYYPDAPVRLKIKFAETPYELSREFSDYHGSLCAGWLQEEIVLCDDPVRYTLPRRYAFRYVKITVLDTAKTVKLCGFSVDAVTSADVSRLLPIACEDEKLQTIDRVAAKTLAECMQAVYEDGPKRDRRLWLGDFRVQALTDYETFKNHDLVKRCLYLFAYFWKEDDFLPPCIFEKTALYDVPYHLVDYALLFAAVLAEYLEYTGDAETARELFPVAKTQIDCHDSYLDADGIILPDKVEFYFLDHGDIYKQPAAAQGVFLFCLDRFCTLASALGEEKIAEEYREKLEKCRSAAKKRFYCPAEQRFAGSPYSLLTQAWMVLGGVIGQTEAQAVMKAAICGAEIRPVSPYAHHYVVEALCAAGLLAEAKAYILDYWGGMVERGADTFWEFYDPQNPSASNYEDDLLNSSCHAWSCSPSYFIRKYFVK